VPPTPSDPGPERAWAERIRDGDEAAYEALFRAHYPPLCAFANGMLDAPDVAEEVVQDVFVKLWRDRAALAIRTSLRAYLYSAVRNGALNQVARRRSEQRAYAESVRAAEERHARFAPPAVELLERAEAAEALGRAVERLPARCRQAVVLRWRHGLKHAEIAEALGISIKGVENHLARGLQALRRDLSARVDPPGS
jgi:RNA polymerase sigma-70 factor (ECF subfamily)